MPHYTALVTLLAIAFYFFLATQVARARTKFAVKHPGTTGHPDFERIFRAHINTLEWLPIFLVPLWLCAIYLSDAGAASVGVVWIVGRIVYFAGYRKSAEGRLPGFFIQVVASAVLFIGAVVGVIMRLAGGQPASRSARAHHVRNARVPETAGDILPAVPGARVFTS